MAHSCRTRRPTRDLAALALQLDAIAEEAGWSAPPLLLGLTAEGIDPGPPPAPLPGASGTDPNDLVASLVGFDAPADWHAMAVVVQGRAWALDQGSADPRPVRLTHVADRTGTVASVVRHAGEEPVPQGERAEGRLVDVCRRSLGLATSPPPPDSTALWALQWLDGIVTRVARGERMRGLAAAALAHPAIELVAEHEPRMVDEAVGRLVRLGQLMGRQRPWSRLHQAAADGTWAVEDLSPEGAAWMDEGMFARWVLADFPSFDDYLAELRDLIPESTVDGIAEVLDQWDLR
jgi:hypothetical protein